ncbi:hypothetical protein AAVH_06746 [Aphelenchoides avenae]|nr:hypothetical protein AAVH_06746 [Aphelenchus avenae]
MRILLLCAVAAFASAITYRDTTVNKYRNLYTSLLSFTQFGTVIDGMAEDVYNCLNKTMIQKHHLDNAKRALTADQMLKVMNVFNNMAKDLGSTDKAQWIVDTCFDVIFNNLNAMIIAYTTFSRVNTTMTRFKSKLTALQWGITFRNLGQVTQLGKYFTA